MSAEEWTAKIDAILKEWRTQTAENPTLSREDAVKKLKALGLTSGEASLYLASKGYRP